MLDTSIRALLTAFLALLFLQGCSNSYKKELLKEELKSELEDSASPILEKEPIEIVEVDAQNFEIINESVPDKQMIRQIKIMGAELDDVISLLTEATGENIIFQLQSENMGKNSNIRRSSTSGVSLSRYSGVYGNSVDEQEIRTSKVFLSAQNIGFGRALNRAIGDKLSVRYDDDTYYIGYVRTVTLKIPSLSGLASKLKQSLETMGALNVAHDTISSSITFSAREREYQDIMRYLELLRDNLYVIEYDMAIYNVELNDNFNLGINWNLLPTGDDTSIVSKTSAAFGSVGASTTASTLGAVFKTSNISSTLIAEALTQFGKVESVQRPRLLGIAGTDVTLVDGLDEPYIKELRTTALGDRATQTSTVSASALSGIRVTLNSNIMDDTVLSDISIEINDIVGYSNFTVDNISYTQPKTQTKSIKNSMRVQPGVPTLITDLNESRILTAIPPAMEGVTTAGWTLKKDLNTTDGNTTVAFVYAIDGGDLKDQEMYCNILNNMVDSTWSLDSNISEIENIDDAYTSANGFGTSPRNDVFCARDEDDGNSTAFYFIK